MYKLFLLIILTSQIVLAEDYEAVSKILKNSCVGCHNTDYAAAGIDLSSYEGVLKTVEPYEPSESLLMDAVLGRNGATPMPMNGDKLSQQDLDDLRFWIEDGAYED